MTVQAKLLAAALTLTACFAQTPAFEVASVKPSAKKVPGRPWSDELAFEPGRISGQYVSLKTMIVEAYQVSYSQISGAPKWIESEEYSIDARAGRAATREEMRPMLKALLSDRFQLTLHPETKEMKAYVMQVDKGGFKLHPVAENAPKPQAQPGMRLFRCDLAQFANLLSIQLKIPVIDDPTRPSESSGTLVPVIDRTGLKGIYDFNLEVRSDPGGDIFTVWQRALQEQAGLRLESQKAPVEMLIIDHAERIPTAN
jgi:uncharacterized protein (TIGR03435 family)